MNDTFYFKCIYIIIFICIIWYIYIKLDEWNFKINNTIPPRFQHFIEKYGKYKIHSMFLAKQELSSFIRNLFDVLTLTDIRDEYFKNGKYYHPYIILKIVDNLEHPKDIQNVIFERTSVPIIRCLKKYEFDDRMIESNEKGEKLETILYGQLTTI